MLLFGFTGGIMARGIEILHEKVHPTLNWTEETPGHFITYTNIGPIFVIINPPNITVKVSSPDNPAIKYNKNFFSMKTAAEGLDKYLKGCGVHVMQVIKKQKKSEKPTNAKK